MGSKFGFRVLVSISVLCAILSMAQGGQLAHTLSPMSSAFSDGVPRFAIGDLDGDQKPDVADVQVIRIDSQSVNYSIRLRFSSGIERSIGVSAPFGGIQIVARDVNGDSSLDLIVSTVLERQPLAVLLNDGHGNFSRVDPQTFLDAFRDSQTRWGCTPIRATTGASAVLPQVGPSRCLRAETLPDIPPPDGSIFFAAPRFFLSSFVTSYAGRAPPPALRDS